MFHEYKEALILQLSSISCRVSLTTDIWTNIKSQSYLVVTCHWIDETWKMQKRYQNFKRQKFKGKSVTRLNSNEIQLYLSQYFETPKNFDVLELGKVNSQLYPILATIARDILPVQASIVAFESAFSMCGRIIGDQRSNLNADTLGMLTCLQDWFSAEKKNRTTGVIDEFASSSSDEDEEYSKYIL
ncbi:zinc finger BED domain-containing protein RICESLEEPER 1-like [Dorcoceras hygrometricum]|uniref:Zinc finger BED domain-containing protein RICESLEEPER 1-like n=1 Tax=Dorcoceras hygrometricum TaxID=472368 RepID=A0A2Z7D8S4_9LAMI|nr:zinc finger BED domain-containing protein RICESLEEPER 1-like [Dorcoceras hygrometricum]